MTKTVIFDMDGLLVNSEPHWKKSMADVFAGMEIFLEEGDYEKTVGLPTSEIIEHWSGIVDWKGKTNQDVEMEIIAKAEELIQNEGELMEGVHYILDFFRDRKFKIGLASSSPMQMINGFLDKFQLRDYFKTLHSGEHHEYGKPHPAVYLACAKELETNPTDCLVFEDSINGMIAGKAAKMTVVAVPEAHNIQDPRYSLADLKLISLKEFDEEKLAKLRG